MTDHKTVDPDLPSYERVKTLADLAAQLVRRRIEEALSRLGDPHLVRGRITAERITAYLLSLTRKALQHKWTFEQALREARDLIGFRVVCNNLQDVIRVFDLLSASLKESGLKVRRDDHVAKLRADGYRAIHLTFPWPVRMENDDARLGCEVHVRSLLQDSWAQLSRGTVRSTPEMK
jgi:ppGpp synthetase/RelA/SpoT-type nucleotidyltranferase